MNDKSERTRQTRAREVNSGAPSVRVVLWTEPRAPGAEITEALRGLHFPTLDIQTVISDAELLAACGDNICPHIGVLYADAQAGTSGAIPHRAFMLRLLGVTRVLLVVGGHLSENRLDEITAAFRAHADRAELDHSVTVSLHPSKIAAGLETLLENDPIERKVGLRVRLETVAHLNERVWRCTGRIESGELQPDSDVHVFPAEKAGRVRNVEDVRTPTDGRDEKATFEIETDTRIGPGHLLATGDALPDVSDQVAAHVVWTAKQRLYPGRTYRLRIGDDALAATVTALKHRVGPERLAPRAARFLDAGDVGFCNLALERPIVFDSNPRFPVSHRFRLFDRNDGEPLGLGFPAYGLRRATNLTRQDIAIGGTARAAMKGQKPCVLWFTGLSGAGKSSAASAVDQQLHALGRHTYLLDGDNVRHGLCRDLGFTEADRVENIRRVAEVARLMVDAGLIVLTSFISPFRSERQMARELLAEGQFVEIFMDTPIEVCEARDIKGLYRKARAGELVNFTGIDSPYEAPERPDIRLRPKDGTAEAQAMKIIAFLQSRGII